MRVNRSKVFAAAGPARYGYGHKKSGQITQPVSEALDGLYQKVEEMPVPKTARAPTPILPVYPKVSKFRIQEEKPMRFRYVCDKDTNYFQKNEKMLFEKQREPQPPQAAARLCLR